jgi:foldase protein PrsA
MYKCSHETEMKAPARGILRRALALFLALAAGLSVAAGLAGCSDSIFMVNGKGISRTRFEMEVNRRLAVVRSKNPKELAGSRGGKVKAGTERDVATEMIRRALMEQQAVKLGVALKADAVSQRIESERQKVGADKFEADLKKQGLTTADYEYKVAGEMLVDALGAKAAADVAVTKDDAESFYLTHKDLFTRSLMVHLAHILLDTQGQAQMVADEAKKSADDFTRLAKELSRDHATKVNGGDLGWIERGTMDPAFEQAAFSMKAGQVSGVVKASDGYHIIRVIERREASTPPFSEVWRDAMKMVESRRKEEAFSDWLRTVYANAKVDADGVGKWDPRIGMVVAP